jgi:hypothetical protein
MPNFEVMHFGDHHVAASRYHGFVAENAGRTLHILVKKPREKITIEGRENVVAAIQEIESCFEMSDEGWHDIG